MRIIFAGTPDFAAHALDALLQAGHEVALVLTQPDRPKGRGMKLTPSPVKALAVQHDIPVWQPESLKDEAIQQQLRDINAQVMVVAAYGLLLPAAVLNIPKFGCLNIHASLLPRWRGAAPIQRAIEAGDTESGVCIMQMDVGLDTGDVLLTKTTLIGQDMNAGQLHEALTAIGAEAIVEALANLVDLEAQVQPETGVTYAQKLSKADAQLDWYLSAQQIHNKIRAMNPVPGAWTTLNGEVVKVWASEVVAIAADDQSAVAGTVVAVGKTGIDVQTADAVLKLTELQASGGKRMPAAAFLSGRAVEVGQIFERQA